MAASSQGFPAVARGGQMIAVLFERISELLGLSGAILNDENLYRGRSARSGLRKILDVFHTVFVIRGG